MVIFTSDTTKAICLNFNLGERYDAPVNLRFDDTNPAKEETQFVEAIKKTLNGWAFVGTKNVMRPIILTQLFDWAKELIKKGLAYVDSQSSEEISNQKGTPTQAGTPSPFRNRSIEENLILFQEMKEAKHPEGAHVLTSENRYGLTQYAFEGPSDVSSFVQNPPQNGGRLVYLSDVRLDSWRV